MMNAKAPQISATKEIEDEAIGRKGSENLLPPTHEAICQSAIRAITLEQAGLGLMIEELQSELGTAFYNAVTAIQRSNGRLIITGMGKSGHVGRKMAATFASTGTPAMFVHPAEASHGDLGMVQPQDVILALSWSGETTELRDIVAYAVRFRVTLIAITSNSDSALAQAADIALVLPKAEEACPNGLAPTTSTTMQLALGDALAVALLEARGFTARDFRNFHPGGKLGSQLKAVRDVMHTGERLPLLPDTALMAHALVEMTAKGFGCALITDAQGQLTGMITDGDLRRHMGADLPAKGVKDVMTQNPQTIGPDMLLVEALEMVENRKIAALIVTQNQRPVGLVHILDLLRLGVA
jgi:arabinose-5-phosphate isomerase